MSHLPLQESPDNIALPIHGTARWARLKLPADIFHGYRKFAVVRNPYDRAVSYYNYLAQQQDHRHHGQVSRLSFIGFLEFVAGRARLNHPTQLSFLADQRGEPLVDDLLRFENLAEDFGRVCAKIGLPHPALPHHNASERRSFHSYYADGHSRDLVRELFADDFKAFGYSTDLPAPH